MRLKKAQFANQRTAPLIKCSANSRSNRARIQAQQQRNGVKQDEKSCVSCLKTAHKVYLSLFTCHCKNHKLKWQDVSVASTFATTKHNNPKTTT